MNAFRFAGDMSHLFSILVLLLKIYATKSCSGISLKTQELYALVFLTRYLDLFTYVVSVYNTLMKIVFISSSIAIVWCMRFHPVVRRTYDKEQDTFRHYLLVGVSLVLALLFHERFTIREVRLRDPSSIQFVLYFRSQASIFWIRHPLIILIVQ
ncbi:hypothetical protein BHE74_00047151 [Ensete ventricosum]|uniref:Uncharacterized protein n=1 Tax=Ensete ventricosum TaxID=4639 RepID=A0A444F2M4_ENSVE|nr:hypothetical protein B296_00046141 [Ensete ventricosum]RWW16875.1 hypothetical protein GW17_00019218 [Ensete ventricosum]RWW46900.1 hypothetical protein BHE74_00047151 [Ensete ventricosum]RZS03773.1 hypothetical protein BHM03_00034003 [Ensete ventricosum]